MHILFIALEIIGGLLALAVILIVLFAVLITQRPQEPQVRRRSRPDHVHGRARHGAVQLAEGPECGCGVVGRSNQGSASCQRASL
jgi:hypothetical protein